ncbi:alpha/beta hydrolase [Mycolicibacterium madagascariense]|uniref:Alpha/beta hydrolase n=1 Tax=Mycolicibacterium madagascariense TaxID=212765 RepID=A0A7I7X9A9_9MYCO|nr:alpha/beta hydrolase [Mycolicibacterium madagascariense]BBZ26276.1 alpha/beta hydrolase [Mycolicibacterium madagascariense]
MTGPTVVLVHGAFADASGYAGVITELRSSGHTVFAPANPLRSLTSDANTLKEFVAAIDGPVVLVGHSYGGAVITQASAALDNVVGLVYLAAFGLDVGESCQTVQEPFPGTLLGKNIAFTTYDAVGAPGGPDVYVAKDFHETFCADLDDTTSAVMEATQRFLSAAAYTETLTAAGWKTIPSWFLVSEHDNSIHPDAERFMAERMQATTHAIDGSHVAFIAKPKDVAEFIRLALA